MLDDVFEALTAALRPRGAQVLKFLGDGMLASFAFVDATCSETCSLAFDAAAEAMRGTDRLNADRTRTGKPIAVVDLALHVGEVLYGNVGAVDLTTFMKENETDGAKSVHFVFSNDTSDGPQTSNDIAINVSGFSDGFDAFQMACGSFQ
jgi:hypothetical protein